MLHVTAIREDGSWWGVDARTLRQALKAARHLRWRHRWPTWISDPSRPADVRTMECWRQWHVRQRQRELEEGGLDNPPLRAANPGLYRVQ